MSASVVDGAGARQRSDLGRILVVDGPPEWQQLLSETLRSEGFETLVCDSGGQAKVLVGVFHPEVVVMAADQADIPAAELCSWIRSRSAVPIVVISQRRDFDAASVLDLGADLVLREPVGRSELPARLRAVLRRTSLSPAHEETVITFGSLVLDRGERAVHLHGIELPLEGREFSLMEALVLGRGRVVSRGRLQALLRVGSAELDGYVRRLRQRVEDVEGWRRIISERGIGLRLLERRPSVERTDRGEPASA